VPNCTLYRRKSLGAQEGRPQADATAHKLPVDLLSEDNWQTFWVRLEAAKEFDQFEFQPKWNPDLTRRILFDGLKRSTKALLHPQEYFFPENSFIEEASFVTESHEEGDELLVVQPYSLRALRQSGFLVDFHFRLRSGVAFSRTVQRLSLSLDKKFRRNIDYYVDRSTKIRHFLERHWRVFEHITLPGTSSALNISKDFTPLPAERLRSKVYVFANNREARSQFTGLRDFGPLQPVGKPTKLLFAFREEDRAAARRLAISLKGLKQRGQFNFPGYKALFKTELEIDPDPIIFQDLSSDSMRLALDHAQADRNSSHQVVPIIVLPSGDDNGYMDQKSHFSHAGLPTQVCTLRILEDEETLKWAIGNLALQVFCKAGGQPWKVRPTAEKSLIIGISQSHKSKFVNGTRCIDKHFAFSILTDNSGLFHQIQVLGDDADHKTYLAALRMNLKHTLEQSSCSFKRVVVHTSFKLRHDEIKAIRHTTSEVAEATDRSKCRFSVIKVNQKNRFFGVNRAVNSLVPFEATRVQLGRGEYLVWFEGIYPGNPNVTKALPGPTHLQFLSVDKEEVKPAEERELLQDLINLSGANWRGFNAKNAPVSVFYCHLVADLVRNFHERGLPLPAVQDIKPWFL
jgi:hypothetical protein